jgi:hypothetical protein
MTLLPYDPVFTMETHRHFDHGRCVPAAWIDGSCCAGAAAVGLLEAAGIARAAQQLAGAFFAALGALNLASPSA